MLHSFAIYHMLTGFIAKLSFYIQLYYSYLLFLFIYYEWSEMDGAESSLIGSNKLDMSWIYNGNGLAYTCR